LAAFCILVPAFYFLLPSADCRLSLESEAKMRGHRDLKVYQLAYNLAMEIFHESKAFPIVDLN
jgi:hypothetical protein